ncbi:MAG: CHAT domain-containing protein [Pseudomonadota bacterium]
MLRIFALFGFLFAWCGGALANTPLTPESLRDQAFVTAQRADTSVAGDALQKALARLAAKTPLLSALVRLQQDEEENIARLREAFFAATEGTGVDAEAEVERLEEQLEQAKARLVALGERLALDFPAYADLVANRPLTREDVQQFLKPGEALVLIITDIDESYLWAIGPQQATWHRAGLGTNALAQRVKTLRQSLALPGSAASFERGADAMDDEGEAPAAARQFDRALAHELYKELLAPLAPVLDKANHVIMVRSGPLASLPFAMLVTDPPPANSKWSDVLLEETPWLIRKQALSTLPVITSLRIMRQGSGSVGVAAREPFIGFGDPLLGSVLAEARKGEENVQVAQVTEGEQAVYTRGVFDNIMAVADLAPLPNTRRELLALAEVTGAAQDRLFMGAEASEAQVKATDFSRARIIAFATHGLLAGGIAGLEEPALVFTPPEEPTALDDGLLTANEAAALNLSADLVILSACDTAGSDGTPGAEGLTGLARSFLYAGAKALLVSHWPVDDYAASALTTRLIERMNAGGASNTLGGRAAALRHSILALMEDPKARNRAHPRIWAPFVVVGEGG